MIAKHSNTNSRRCAQRTQHAMYAADKEEQAALSNTAFRAIEKQFHPHLPASSHNTLPRLASHPSCTNTSPAKCLHRIHRRRQKPTPQPLPHHLLIDPRNPTPPFATCHTPPAIVSDAHPGLVLFPGALDSQTQLSLARRCVLQFPNAPCTTNHTALHGLLHDLWGASQSDPHSAKLLRKLRWACVGPAYDWTSRLYLHGDPHLPLPADLVDLALQHAAAATAAVGCQAPVEPFKPDAALVNYYRPGDTLGGHQDDVEVDQSQPIVSISLGCSAVFLIGGETRDVAPHALLLRSGDVVVLTGAARRCFHGVPRVLEGGFDCASFEGDRCVLRGWWRVCVPYHGTTIYRALVDYLQQARINISIRATT